MNKDWYCSLTEEQIAPVSETESRSLGVTGRLAASGLVWQARQPNWIPAASVPELFPGPPPLPGWKPRRRNGKALWPKRRYRK